MDYDNDEDTDRAMLGAGGDDGLTAEEAAGMMMNGGGKRGRGPALPPDQLRVAHHAAESRAAGNVKYLPTTPSAASGAGDVKYLPTSSSSTAGASASAFVFPTADTKNNNGGGGAQPPHTPDVRSKRMDAILGAAKEAVREGAGGDAIPSPAFTVQNMDDMD